MSRHLLLWLLQTHAFDDASPRHDTRGYELPTVLGDLRIDHGFVEHVARHPNRGAFANYVLPTLKEPHEVWLTHVGSSRGGAFRHHFLAAFDDGVTAVVVVEPGEAPVAWNFFPVKRRTDVRKRRKGMLLYSRRQEGGEG